MDEVLDVVGTGSSSSDGSSGRNNSNSSGSSNSNSSGSSSSGSGSSAYVPKKMRQAKRFKLLRVDQGHGDVEEEEEDD